jgi:hypothetical protein
MKNAPCSSALDSVHRSSFADDRSLIEKQELFVFSDDFEREDGSTEKDDWWRGMDLNSPWRALRRPEAGIQYRRCSHVITVEDAGHKVLFQELSPCSRTERSGSNSRGRGVFPD